MEATLPDVWLPEPRKLPYRCHATSLDQAKDGPFYEGFVYCEPGGDDREMTWYASRVWLESVLDAPGSPFAKVTGAELAALVIERDALLARCEQLEERLADTESALVEAQAEIQTLREDGTADAIAGRVAKFLEDRLPAKQPARTR